MKKRLFLLVLAVLMLFATTATPVDASDFFICYETLSPDKDSYYLGETIRIDVTYSNIDDTSKITGGKISIEYYTEDTGWKYLDESTYNGFDFEFTPDKAGKYAFTVNVVYVPGDSYMSSRNTLTVEALENETPESEYTVFFASNGHGEEIENQIVKAGETAVRPANPTEKGWIFEGWYEDATLKYEFDFSTIIGTNTHLYAKWTEEKQYEMLDGANATWDENSNTELTFRSEAPFEKLKYAVIDGEIFCCPANGEYSKNMILEALVGRYKNNEILFQSDNIIYYVNADGTISQIGLYDDSVRFEPGSTKVILSPEFLKELGAGNHTIEIVSTDGTAKARFTINAAPTSDTTETPKTGVTPEPAKNPEKEDKPDKTPKTGDNGLTLAFGALLILGAAFAGTIGSKKK